MLFRRLASVLVGFGFLASAGAPSALAVNVPAGGLIGNLPGWPEIKDQSTQVDVLRPGVTISSVELLLKTGLQRIYQLDVDLRAPGVRVANVLSHNSVVSTGETISSMATRTGALAGVNGDYFAIKESGVPLNWTVQNKNLIRSGNQWAVFGITTDGEAIIGKYAWLGSLKVNDKLSFPIEAVNLPLMDHKVIAVNQSMGSTLAAKSATLAYLAP
jgi:hypothetical protein